MAVKFQFNKVSLQALQKELKVRQNALPTLKSKESYLRVTIKNQKSELADLEDQQKRRREEMASNDRLWAEFPSGLFRVASVETGEENVAGIRVPSLKEVRYEEGDFSAFLSPPWFVWGLKAAKELSRLAAEIETARRRITLLEYARKKTTQKVNLYEKVQIPEFSESILKIKRYLEDVENLDKAAQKITKSRQEAAAGMSR